jgi:ABC-2 type transport system permease protein
VTGLLILIPVIVTYPLLKDYLTLPSDWWRLALGLPALLMSAVIQFGIAYCFGLMSFWFLEIQGLVVLSMALESLLGGQIFPLDLLPDWLFRVSQFLPYYYQMYFPVAIFTGRLSDPSAIMVSLGIQAGWMLIILAIGQFLWRRGLRLHTAVGG